MPLEKAEYWTDTYYSIVENYFWAPQSIGRKANPEKTNPWSYWKGKLQSQEVPLNHILDLMFHLAADDLTDQVGSAFLNRRVSGLNLKSAGLDENLVQPDIILANDRELVFVEMKVDSRSSIDQFVKYAIAAQLILADAKDITTIDLAILSRTQDHSKVWRRAKIDQLTSVEAVRAHAIRGLSGDLSVWKEKGVPRYIMDNPNAVPGLRKIVSSMGLGLVDYEVLAKVLRAYMAENPAVSRLIGGVLVELKRRDLIAA